MAEEAVIEAGEQVQVDSPAFGNITEAFDLAFPATAEKEEVGSQRAEVGRRSFAEAASAPEPEPALAPKPKVEAPAPAPAATDGTPEMPESIFGESKPKEEVPPVEPQVEVPKSLTKPKDIATWKELRGAYETTKAELAKRTVEVTQLQEKAKTIIPDDTAKARIEELTRKNEELSSAVERTSLIDHPAFKANITEPRERAMAEARSLLSDAKIDPKQLDRAMSLSGEERLEALNDLYADLPEAAKAELAASVREVRHLDAKRDELLKNSAQTLAQLQQQDKISRHVQIQAHEEQTIKMLSAAEAHLREKIGFEVLKKVDDPKFKQWNDQADEILSDAKTLLTKTTDPAQHALAAIMAASAPTFRALFQRERSQRLALAKELAEIKGGEPSLRGNSDRTAADNAGDDKLSFAESVARNSGLR